MAVAIDLLSAQGQVVTPKKAAAWTFVWVSLAMLFAGYLSSRFGTRVGVTWVTAWVIEYALSVDNLFVFIVVFAFFQVAPAAQHKLLYWGILGAFVLRGLLIGLGTALVAQFEWLLYGFGAFLLFTAYKLLFAAEQEENVDPGANPLVRAARRVLPVTSRDHGLLFFAREEGKFVVTRLFIALLVIETTDVLFALDSIPAVMGITKDPFLVFTSNASAILGLRSLFFLVSSLMASFRYLKVGLGVILGFVGVKLCLETAFQPFVLRHEGALILGSLGFIGATLLISVVASLKAKAAEPAPATLEKAGDAARQG